MVLTVQNLQKLKVVKVMLTSLLPHTIYKYRLKIHFHKQNHHCGYIYIHTHKTGSRTIITMFMDNKLQKLEQHNLMYHYGCGLDLFFLHLCQENMEPLPLCLLHVSTFFRTISSLAFWFFYKSLYPVMRLVLYFSISNI